jgi:ADP-dependent NAD(P)H-hydrate dehydratase / NAD(P)H-hydrate epimerase
MPALPASDPILSCAEAREFEAARFGGDEALEWPAMQRAGRALAAAVLRDFLEIGGFPPAGRVLVLAGKGHNAGDALLAAGELLKDFPGATVDVLFIFGERALRPLAARAWRELVQRGGERVRVVAEPTDGRFYSLCLDGIFGFQFRPPVEPRVAAVIERINAASIRFRAAVDLPSAELFRADFTYATGIVKTPVLASANAGRVRYLDLGFFEPTCVATDALARVLTPALLAPLAALRASQSDKRTYGHVGLVGGSRDFPGAILMAALAALRSGAGLVTAFVPESLAAAFAARAPEVMWVGWPETPAGGLALEGNHLLQGRRARLDALVIGPGLGREAETLALVRDIVATSSVPVVLDADALQADIVGAGLAARVLTPHAGEWVRVAGSVPDRAVVVLKGPVTRIQGGGTGGPVYFSLAGGPVLARGGSGDLLAGLIGGLLAQTPADPMLAAARGTLWHGLAADALARAHGQTSVMTTQVLDYLGPVLREVSN